MNFCIDSDNIKKKAVNYALIKYLYALMYAHIKQKKKRKKKRYATLKPINYYIIGIKHVFK